MNDEKNKFTIWFRIRKKKDCADLVFSWIDEFKPKCLKRFINFTGGCRHFFPWISSLQIPAMKFGFGGRENVRAQSFGERTHWQSCHVRYAIQNCFRGFLPGSPFPSFSVILSLDHSNRCPRADGGWSPGVKNQKGKWKPKTKFWHWANSRFGKPIVLDDVSFWQCYIWKY